MYELVEFENESFNHYLHHFDEWEEEGLLYNEEYDCIEAPLEIIEEIIW